MTTKSIEQLQSEIEKLVRAHLAAQKAAASAAIERAFAVATTSKPKASTPSPRAWGRRRPPTEVAGIAERLYDAVRAHPGETMAVIAAEVGESALALSRPMHHLKNAGRVRSAGQRHLTRYFPMSSKSA
jgi:acyl-CoA reductase-like NAD-dependent aldehyde dehydrogenase